MEAIQGDFYYSHVICTRLLKNFTDVAIALFLMNRRSLFGDLNDGAIALFFIFWNRRSLVSNLNDGVIALFLFFGE